MSRGHPTRLAGRLILAVLLLAIAALVSVTPSATSSPKRQAQATSWSTDLVSHQRAEELEFLVRQDCGSCHGMTLKGGLGPDLRAQTLAGTDPETLALIILDGVPDSPMPPWRPLLSEADAQWIAHYLLAPDQIERDHTQEGEKP